MQDLTLVNRFLKIRYLFFKWRYSLTFVNKILLSFIMACSTGILARFYIPLPFTPVPITGQVLGVLLSGVICGGIFGSFSQLIYVGLGIMGVPWFAGGKAGSLSYLISPTGGYLIGFIITPLVIGRYTDKYISSRTFLHQLKFMFLGVGIIYFFGATFLALVIKVNFWQAILKGVIPFVGFDLIKAIITAGVSSSILPKASYNGEVNKEKYLKYKC